MESYNSEEHEFDTQKVLDKMKHNECKALIHAITHTLSFFFEIVFVVFITLKITDIIDWSWWIITSPIWGGSIINVCIAIGILIIWRQR